MSLRVWVVVVAVCFAGFGARGQDSSRPLGTVRLAANQGVVIASSGGAWEFDVPAAVALEGKTTLRFVLDGAQTLRVVREKLEVTGGGFRQEVVATDLGQFELFDDGVSVYASWVPVKDADLSGVAIPPITAREPKSKTSVELRIGSSEDAAAPMQAESIVFLLDASGSMRGERLEKAKEALLRASEAISKESEFALVVLYDCGDIRTELALGHNQRRLRSRVAGIEAVGGTPLGDALQKSFELLTKTSRYEPDARRIVLLSDGRSTCGSNPVSVVSAWKKLNPPSLAIVGLEVGTADEAQLKRIAEEAGGVYQKATRENVKQVLRRSLDGSKPSNDPDAPEGRPE